MARDRKRAKQRQQRRARSGSRAASTPRDRAPEPRDDDELARREVAGATDDPAGRELPHIDLAPPDRLLQPRQHLELEHPARSIEVHEP